MRKAGGQQSFRFLTLKMTENFHNFKGEFWPENGFIRLIS